MKIDFRISTFFILNAAFFPLASYAAPLDPQKVQNLFFQATTAPLESYSDKELEIPIWRRDSAKIGFFVEGNEKSSILAGLSEEFDDDRRFIEEATGMKLSLGYWADKNPNPSIFILLGRPEELIARAHFLSRKFEFPKLVEEFEKRFVSDDALCNSFAKVSAKKTIEYALITVDITQNPNYCLRRQLIVALGLVGDLPAEENSILSLGQRERFYTELDRALLKILYSDYRNSASIGEATDRAIQEVNGE